jgi:phosphomannomutase
MRRITEKYPDQYGHQIDGMLIEPGNEGEWVLVLPDPDKALLHVYAESASDERAAQLADEYAGIVEQLRS